MSAIVLDSYALLAYFRGEESGAKVRDLLQKATNTDHPLHMSDVNYAEVKYMLLKKNGTEAWEQASEVLKSLLVQFHSTTRALSDIAANFKSRYKMSLADAFGAALAKAMNAEFVTGDPEFKALEKEIKIRWLK